MPPVDRLPQGMEPRFFCGMGWVSDHQQAWVKEHLFRLALGYAMRFVLSGVAWIPIKANDALEFDHKCILP